MTEKPVPFDPALFDSPAHRRAQAACRHLIHCAVDGPTRGAVVANLAQARRVSDPALPILLAQLTGPCCLPPATEDTA